MGSWTGSSGTMNLPSKWAVKVSIFCRCGIPQTSFPGQAGSLPHVLLIFPRLQHRHERLLRDVDLADRFHPLFAFFLLLPQLPLAGDVAAVAFGGDVFSHRGLRLAGDDAAADGGLD